MTEKELAIDDKTRDERAMMPMGKSLLAGFLDEKLSKHTGLKGFTKKQKAKRKKRKAARAARKVNR